MADQSNLLFVNSGGEYEESASTDSLQYASFKTATYELTDALLGKLVNAINVSAGAGDAGKFILLDANGHVDATMINDADIDHGSVGGLADDDHTQYILVAGTRAFTGAQSMGSFKLTNLADGTASSDAVNYGQLQSALAGLSWKDTVRGLKLIGERTIALINALSPEAGDCVVATDAGTPTAGTSDALAAGDVAEFDGTSWKKVVSNSAGRVPNGIRFILAKTTALVSPFVEATDDNKIVISVADPGTYDGSVSDWDDTGDAVDNAAVLIQDPTHISIYDNLGFTLEAPSTVPTGSWIQFSGASATTAGAGLYASGNTFNVGNGDGITVDTDAISVDLLTGGGLKFTGASPNGELGVEPNDFAGEGLIDDGSDNLAIDWSTAFNDSKAVKASDLSSTANGKGASIIGVEDASAYWTGTDVEAVLDEIEAQLGGTTSTTYGFSEDNVLADNDAVYAALNKLDLKWGDLASTATSEGASLVGIEDAGGFTSAATVEAALQELYGWVSLGAVSMTVGTGGVTKGDLLYISANDEVKKLPITGVDSDSQGIGLAASTEIATASVAITANDTVLTGVLSTATAGDKYYWDGSTLTTTIPITSGARVWRVGSAKNATDLYVQIEFVKRNA